MNHSSGARLVAVTGAGGMIGSALSEALRGRGDRVLHLVRRAPRVASDLPEGVREVRWNPGQDLAPDTLAGVDAVVHLAGAGIADGRWTEERKEEILSSRVDGTTTLARALAGMPDPSSVRLVSGSAVGFYGDRDDAPLTEASEPGDGFLAEVCRAWESATASAEEAGVPVAHARTGIVLAPAGGALGPLMRLAKLGLAGPMGGGEQYWSWITLHDHVRALLHLVDNPLVTGPVNLTAPNPATQRTLVRALASELGRPAVVPAPTFALNAVLGEMATEILSSARVYPDALERSGFTFDHDDLGAAMAWVVAEHRARD